MSRYNHPPSIWHVMDVANSWPDALFMFWVCDYDQHVGHMPRGPKQSGPSTPIESKTPSPQSPLWKNKDHLFLSCIFWSPISKSQLRAKLPEAFIISWYESSEASLSDKHYRNPILLSLTASKCYGGPNVQHNGPFGTANVPRWNVIENVTEGNVIMNWQRGPPLRNLHWALHQLRMAWLKPLC